MENADYLYKTKPNYIFIVLMVAGAGFSIFLSSLAWPAKEGNITADIFLLLFCLFALLCLSLAIASKIIYLTATEIIITVPVFFYKRILLLSEIKSLNDKKVMVNIDSKSFTPKLTQIGNKVIVIMKDGKEIQLSSLQIWNYREFRKNLRLALVSNGSKHHQ